MAVCPQCGNAVRAGEHFCAICGRDLAGPQIAPTAVSHAGMSPVPLGTPAPTSGKAIASLILGIFFFFLPASILAIIFGHLSLSDIKKSAGRLQGRGLAITGLVLGYGGIAIIPVVLIIAAIAIPSLLRARITADETSAVAAVHGINQAEIRYRATYSGLGFACHLEALGGRSDSCSPSAEHACFLDDSLATGRKSGYIFELRSCASEQDGAPPSKYQLVAYPEKLNASGVRAFCSDETGVVRWDGSGSAERCLESGQPLE